MTNNRKNTLSVLLPNYNNELYLKEALDSLFNQTYQDFLIFFIDDGSTDRSIEIAKSYNDERLIIIEKPSNSGIVDTLNVGLAKIETDYFIRMDGDDIAPPERFEKLIHFMISNPEIDICGSNIQYFGLRDEYIEYNADSDKIKARLIFGHGVGHATAIFKTATLKANNIEYKDDFKRLEDYYLFFRLRDFTKSTNLSEPLYLYRQEEFNNNVEVVEMMKLEYRKMYHIVLAELFSDISSLDIELHMGLSGNGDLKHDFNLYQQHSERLMSANILKDVYPREAFESLIKLHLASLRFKLVDLKKIKLGSLIQNAIKGDVKFLRYYLAGILKKNN